MFSITKDCKLAIYVAERQMHDPTEHPSDWYHTCLISVDETNSPPTILHQLHFNDDVNGLLEANTRLGTHDKTTFKEALICPILGGKASEILTRWKHILNNAFVYNSLGDRHPFGEDYKTGHSTINCRAAVIACLRSINIETVPEMFAEPAGTLSHEINLYSNYTPAENLSVPEVLSSINNFHQALEASWTRGSRYLGPSSITSQNIMTI